MQGLGYVIGVVGIGLATGLVAEERIVQATDGPANLRNAAGWWAEIEGLAANGTKATVLARSGGWVWVQLDSGAVGWLPANELGEPKARPAPVRQAAIKAQVAPLVAAAPAERPEAPEGKYLSVVLTRDSALNLRRGPGIDHGVVAEMTRGSWVEVQENSGAWVRLRHESGVEGWALRRYLVR